MHMYHCIVMLVEFWQKYSLDINNFEYHTAGHALFICDSDKLLDKAIDI